MKKIISIPGGSAAEILKSLCNNNIDTNYMGIDQSGKLLMEISYQPEQDALINNMLDYMKRCEEFVAELSQVFEKALHEKGSKLNTFIESLKQTGKEQQEKPKTKTDGNEQSKIEH
jgi:hypothetical protein